ncbi:MAG TPA: amino acid adenylation domain-containing protein, partial [Herpetosiphonaceae bacterium]
FALCGHSLLATQVVARVREAFQVELPLRTLFEMATVAELAERITSMQRAEWQIPSLVPIARESTPPLSYAQQRLWFIDRLQPNSAAYNIPAAWRVAGPLDVAALAHSLNTIVARHEVLRTTFAATHDSQPVQVIAAPQPYVFPIIDLQSLPAADRETEARRIIDTEAQRPFDLADGPLLRMALLRLDADEHVLALTMHHIIADGWSMGVLINELATLYAARIHGEPAALPALPIQYADYAVWQRDWLRDEILETHLAYWKQQLADLVVLELPTDYPRPAALSDRGAGHIFVLPQALSDELALLSRREGVTLFMTLLAAWQVLLARYSGQSDIAVGTPIANRTQAETEHLIGFFVNTLVLRTDLTGSPSFREVLARVREVCLGAYAHQDLPFEQLVDVVRPTRDLSHNPLFQVMFTLGQASAAAGSELPGLNLQPLSIERQTAQFDLTLTMDETPTGLVGMLEYSVDLFAAPTIERMANHFQTLLEGITAQPERSYADLPLLSAHQRQQLLVDWNTTDTAYAHELCLHHLFEATAKRTPEAIAVVYEAQQLTYQELNARANQLAHELHERGVGPEVRVGLCVERSLEMVVGLLGILKAGGAYLPLDPTYPTERLAFVLADAQVPLVLTQEHLRAQLPATTEVICLDAEPAGSVDAGAMAPRSGVRSTNAAYVIYTSGSTGVPKGVLVEHQALVNYTLSMLPHFDLQPRDRMLQFASPSFDVVVEELFPTWAAGAAVVLHGAGILASIAEFTVLLDQAQVTAVELPVAYWHAWVDEMVQSGQKVPASLRLVLLGCEKPSLDRLATWQRFDVRSIYVFGLTETAITSTLYHVPSDPTEGGKWSELPIGRPVANTQIYALDARLQPVPIGVPGELFIGGDGLARNYLNQPGQTAARFVPNPFSDVPGARLYRTGDLVRYRPDGNLEFLGRSDAQVKVRGFRVELGEVEAALGQHPGVRDAVVILRGDGPGGKQLVAYVVENQEPRTENQGNSPEPGSRFLVLGSSELRSFLLDRLPEYMVPSAFVLLDVLPLTSHGKVDRAALPAPDTARPELAETFAAPQTATETLLAAIWASVLRREQIGIHDNFFALGGDSILSIQIIARANQAGLRLTPRQLFQHQTIASLAAVAGTAPEQTAEQGLVTGPVPLTPIQHWFFTQDLPERHHWNQSALFEVRQPLDGALLEQAVQQVLAHHDALRLRVERTADGWRQINPGLDATPLVQAFDLRAVPLGEQAAAITQAATQLQTSLDLHSGPLLRVGSFTLGDDQPGRLLLVVHHLAVDTVSWGILLEDLQTAYAQ